ncbi:hypothetical protein [Allopontixanthobacter sediminis]|uniref:Phage tail tube protein n=1 Tax=Allopontixanthobacter sediminis TaxID=1689985 RepID=A0A845AYG8_9SPHN|nr:hypothetical protein [Allopontixanthobacter sediminis]MXP42988.1 hypothetical protein [Allopontixanthobacter sediminis]
MSLPVEADFAVVKRGDGADPEVFTILCGLDQVSINRTANTNDRFRRDCTKPGVPAFRRSKTTGKQMDISASGAINIPDIALYNTALGVTANYKIELGQYDDTDTGTIVHTIDGPFNLLSANSSVGDDNSAEVSLASDGIWVEVTA